MFGVSFSELLVIGLIALIVFGPEQLPDIAKTIGRFIGKLKVETDKAKREFYNSVYEPAKELEQEAKKITRELKTVAINQISDPKLIEEKSKDEPSSGK